jgi:hypothetical protein
VDHFGIIGKKDKSWRITFRLGGIKDLQLPVPVSRTIVSSDRLLNNVINSSGG